MKLTSILAIYLLFWVFTAFVVLPFHARTHNEAGIEMVPGQADSAPASFDAWRVGRQITLVSAGLFGIYYVLWVTETFRFGR